MEYTGVHVAKTSKVEEAVCINVVISIEQMLKKLPPVNKEGNIYRVPKELREMNPKAYNPQIISIGPFHHYASEDLKVTEQYKLQGLMNFLRRLNYTAVEFFMEAPVNIRLLLDVLAQNALSWMEEVRNSYVEPIKMDNENLIKMMLVDGCFMVEYFIQSYDKASPESKFFQIQDNVDLLSYPEVNLHILHDLIKLENQVPFFLLQNLYDLIPKDGISKNSTNDQCSVSPSFLLLVYNFLGFEFIGEYHIYSESLEVPPVHFVDLFCYFFIPLPNPDVKNNKQNGKKNIVKKKNLLSFFKVNLCCLLWPKQNQENNKKTECIDPPSISELCEAGVTIKKAENTKSLTDISFKNGVLEIPTILICDSFELFMRNLIAFEHIPTRNKTRYATQYVLFLDELINTEEDVHLLVKAGVLINYIGGSDKEVSDLFNNLGKFVTIPNYSPHFDDISKALREHCNGWWNKSKASLKHNYFNTAWAIISFSAATLLIVLTLFQTIFSAKSAFPS